MSFATAALLSAVISTPIPVNIVESRYQEARKGTPPVDRGYCSVALSATLQKASISGLMLSPIKKKSRARP